MTDFYSQNRCVCSTRSHGPLLCAFCLSFHFNAKIDEIKIKIQQITIMERKYMLYVYRKHGYQMSQKLRY